MFFNKAIESILKNCKEPFTKDLVLKNHFEFKYGEVRKRNYLWDIYSDLGIISRNGDHKFYAIRHKKNCPVKKCGNPQCYELIRKPIGFKTDEGRINNDIVELAEDIDLDKCLESGLEAYLEEYNAGVPSFLKTDLNSLMMAVNYLKHKRKDD